jgi:cytoskeletal protein CcmA (bactofilin family)
VQKGKVIKIMGIKENFTQAVKELTGIGKEKEEAQNGTVEELRKAVGDDSATSREITLDPSQPPYVPGTNASDFDLDEQSMTSSVRPMASVSSEQPQPMREQPGLDLSTIEQLKSDPASAFSSEDGSEVASTPAAEGFFSGREVPVSLFGQQPQPATEVATEVAQESQKPEASPPAAQVFPQQSIPTPVQPVQPAQGINQPSSTQPTSGHSPFSSFSPNSVPAANPALRSGGRQEDHELTIISRNTVVDGNVRSFADMSIDGDIKGDVETTKNIDLNGKIIGNITCNNAMMHTSQIQGNVRMKGNVSMKRDTLLMGDLMSTYADINGKVKGNLDVVGKADLKGDAVVFGDISASTITVEDGAIIQGYVSTTFLNKEESKNLFPDTVTIGDVENGASRA